jgi:glutamate synthase (ferredoxin)
VFSDHVAMPFKLGFSSVFKLFLDAGLDRHICFIGSGKLGFPHVAMMAMGLGCDMINVGREAMLAIGCIQAQRCHTDHCPTGVATQNRWLIRGLDPTHKSNRLANYVVTLRKELLQLSHACGVEHPALIASDYLELVDDRFESVTLSQRFGYRKPIYP